MCAGSLGFYEQVHAATTAISVAGDCIGRLALRRGLLGASTDDDLEVTRGSRTGILGSALLDAGRARRRFIRGGTLPFRLSEIEFFRRKGEGGESRSELLEASDQRALLSPSKSSLLTTVGISMNSGISMVMKMFFGGLKMTREILCAK